MMPFTPGNKTGRRKLSGHKTPPSWSAVAAELKVAALAWLDSSSVPARTNLQSLRERCLIGPEGSVGSESSGARWM